MVEDEGLCFLCLAPCNDLCPHCKLVHFCSQDHLRLHRYYSNVTKKHLQCKRYPQSRSPQARHRVLAVQSRPASRQGSSSFCNSRSQVSGEPQEEAWSWLVHVTSVRKWVSLKKSYPWLVPHGSVQPANTITYVCRPLDLVLFFS